MSKAEIVALGVSLGAPLEHTWSCYEGKDLPSPAEQISEQLADAHLQETLPWRRWAYSRVHENCPTGTQGTFRPETVALRETSRAARSRKPRPTG